VKHLRPEELTDALDQALPPDRQAHADACGECRGRLTELRRLLDEARGVPATQPSPLFWDEFPRRVRAAIDAERDARAAPWGRIGLAAAALVVAIVALGLWRTDTPQPSQQAERGVADLDAGAQLGAAAGEDWDLMLSIAQDMDWDTAREAGFEVRPGGADAAVALLSEGEQRELARLLREELKEPVS